MAVTAFFKSKKTIDRLHEGPVGAFIDTYADRLVAEGHSYQSGARCIRRKRSLNDVSCIQLDI